MNCICNIVKIFVGLTHLSDMFSIVVNEVSSISVNRKRLFILNFRGPRKRNARLFLKIWRVYS